MSTRQAAVAGMFYPDNALELQHCIQGYVKSGQAKNEAHKKAPDKTYDPKILVLPHAGYIYSGQTAGEGYACLHKLRSKIKKVAILGPCHRVAVRGIAVPKHDVFMTPLGEVKLDQQALSKLIDNDVICYSNEAHAQEHCLEVHLPFLQEMIGEFELLPFVVGEAAPELVAELITKIWGGDETLIIVSTDLSHFLNYEQAVQADTHTIDKILNLEDNLIGEEACGCKPLNGVLHYAKQHELNCDLLHCCNSGDTAGDKDRVVGYASFVLY